MAHFARLADEETLRDGITGREVLEVVVISNTDAPDEATGLAWIETWRPGNGPWKQTSYNANFRMNFAGIGFLYAETLDGFIGPRPSEDHTLDETTGQWKGPSPGEGYTWDGYRWQPPMEPGEPPE